MTVLKTETETAVFSHNTDRNRPSSDDPQPLQHYSLVAQSAASRHWRNKFIRWKVPWRICTHGLVQHATVVDCEYSGEDTDAEPAGIIAAWCRSFADISYVAVSSFFYRSSILRQHRLSLYASRSSHAWQKCQQSIGSVNTLFIVNA